jgi:hypothetical protein
MLHSCISLYRAYYDFVIFSALHFDFIRNEFLFVTAIANEIDMRYAIDQFDLLLDQFVIKCFMML